MDWIEKWGRATMGMTVHSTLSAVNIATGGLAIPLTTAWGVAYDANVGKVWNWLESSRSVNWLGGRFYSWGLF